MPDTMVCTDTLQEMNACRVFYELQATNQIQLFRCIRLVAHIQIHPGLFIYDTAQMGKFFKTVLAMVAAHAAFAHTTERHLGGCQVDDGIVDAAASESASDQNLFFHGLAFREAVQRQRTGMGLNGVCLLYTSPSPRD